MRDLRSATHDLHSYPWSGGYLCLPCRYFNSVQSDAFPIAYGSVANMVRCVLQDTTASRERGF